MFKKLSVIFILCIAASIMTVYAENTDTNSGEYPDNSIIDGNGEVSEEDRIPPPIVVDENFKIDRQDFLDDNTVKDVKIYHVAHGWDDHAETEITFTSGTPYIDEDQRMRVPLRDFSTQLDYSVTWYAETGQAAVCSNSSEIWYVFSPDNDVVLCNVFGGATFRIGHLHMDCTPIVIDGVMYVPIRHLANILGYDVVWDEEAKIAKLYGASVWSMDSGPVYLDSYYFEDNVSE